ncbi:ZZ-type zinc finger-containing protein 3 isoform X1 [Parasteatoda tepidariorum]|nr:ZZ-type zinc finger-containing protein 3 isoform X1 [Parasteatoda tepidariorum]
MSSNQSLEDSIDIESVENEHSSEFLREINTDSNKLNEFDFDPLLQRPPKMDFDSIGEFCFESDILALKGNNDYKNVLEAIVILEAQREQAVKDLSDLKNLKDKALADPLEFVEKLKQKEDMDMPSAQLIHPVPTIEWGKYALSGDPVAFKRRQISRIAADVRKNFKRKNKNSEKEIETDCWTLEEEKHLEELLKKYPPEKNQNDRWEKIAECLGNHTASQVNSKVQKSFPLFIGKDTFLSSDSDSRKKRKNAGLEDEIQEKNKGISESGSEDEDSLDSKLDISDDEISSDLHDTAEYQELLLYKRLLKKRIKSSTMMQHFGFKCKVCKSEPIVGIRYHCVECNPSIDLCKDCFKNSPEIGEHTSDHQIEEIHHSNAGFLDRDYMHFLGNDYNYLDPNYMPAA